MKQDQGLVNRTLLASHPSLGWLLSSVAPLLLLATYAQTFDFLVSTNTSILYGWGIGLLGLPVLFLLRPLRRVAQTHMHEGVLRRVLPRWVPRVLCVLVPAAAVTFLQQMDMSWEDLHTTGLQMIAYSVSRFVLAVSLIILCVTSGAHVLRRYAPDLRDDNITPGPWFVLSFFTGASAYGLLVTAMGLLGFLHLLPVAAITAPVMFLAPDELATPIRTFLRKVHADFVGLQGIQWWVRFHLAWCLLFISTMLLLTRGLYPGSTSNDVWSHYLPYYREVLNNGSTLPNELWYHFYISKGAGLIHMLGVLSDPLAAQLVSWSFVAVSGVIVFQLVRSFAGDASWALAGTITFFSVYRGSFFKSHDALAALISFTVWALFYVPALNGSARRALLFGLGIVSFYLGFYQPLGASFPSTFLLISICMLSCVPVLRDRIRPLAVALISVLCGGACALILNYGLTGIAEHAPISVFWWWADVSRFSNEIGTSGLAYMLHAANDQVSLELDLHWLADAFRYRQLHQIYPPLYVAVGLVALLIWVVRRRAWPTPRISYLAVLLFSFVASTVLVSWFGSTSSLLRILIFTTLPSSVLLVLLARIAVLHSSTAAMKRWMVTLFLCSLGVHCVGQELWYLRAVRDVDLEYLRDYFIGRRSFGDILIEADWHFGSALNVEDMLSIRTSLGPDTRVLNLGYDHTTANTYPGAGLVQGVGHTLGPDHSDIVFGSPHRARSILQSLGINFFILNRRSPLFSSVAFSRLFEPTTLDRYLRMYGRKDDAYLLTWRDKEQEPIPADFKRLFELKRSGVLSYPFSKAFRDSVQIALESSLRPRSPERGNSHQQAIRAVVRLLEESMLSQLSLASSRDGLGGLIAATESVLQRLAPRLAASALGETDDTGKGNSSDGFNDRFTELIVGTVKVYMKRKIAEEFGDELAEHLTTVDERKPFGVIYGSRDSFDELVFGERSR